MKPTFKLLTAVISLAAVTLGAQAAVAEKSGGILKAYHRGTPPSGSIHEEATNSTLTPYMPVMNNLIMYDQSKPVNSLDTIVPDLAESWSWSDGGKKLTFKLRQGVKWHDGKPFTSKDVKCTWWDLLLGHGGRKYKLRKNPRKAWYKNLKGVTTNGDHEVTFELGRPQPAFLTSVSYTHLTLPPNREV